MSLLKTLTTRSFMVFLAAWGSLQKRFVEGPIDWSEHLKRHKATMDAPAKKPL